MAGWEPILYHRKLNELHRFIAETEDTSIQLISFVNQKLENLSVSRVQKLINKGNILVNGTAQMAAFRLRAGDVVSIQSPFSSLPGEVCPVEMDLGIVFENGEFLVVNKPAGLAVHPGLGDGGRTLLHGLAWHYQKTGQLECLPRGLVHRLDKGTSGLLVIAKKTSAFENLSSQFKGKVPVRKYNALIWGTPAEEEGTIDVPIGRCDQNPYVIRPYPDLSGGKIAVTHYRTIEKFEHCTLVECVLETGRTHQIRVHFQHLGHPLLGDMRYPLPESSPIHGKLREIKRLALHAKSLSFLDPSTGERVSFETPMPHDLFPEGISAP